MTSTMRALVAGDDGFRIEEIARPLPGLGEVLVRIHASGVNPLDAKVATGLAPHARQPLPAILGLDMAGTIETVGSGVTRFAVGDEVYGMIGGVGGVPGTLADYAVADVDLLALTPARLTMREAAALPLVVITAWEGLVDRAGVAARQTVLIQGGGGGVGHVAVQIARSVGAEVYATVSPRDADYVGSLGATPVPRDMAVDALLAEFTGGRGFDVIYDTVGGSVLDGSFASVSRFGHVVSALGWGTHALAPLSFKAASYSGVFTLLPLITGEGRARHGEILKAAARLVDAGQLTPRLDNRRFGLAETGAAHAALSAGKLAGKLVIDLS